MITRIYNIILIAFATILFSGCSEENKDVQQPETDTLIRLSSLTDIARYNTRAGVTDFPNDGKIGIIATLYNSENIDWTAYPDIDNDPAVAVSKNAATNTYEFEWRSKDNLDEAVHKYWPFDGTPLVFNAYTPYTPYSEDDTDAKVKLRNDRTALVVELHEGMEDIMYATGNQTAGQTPYDKHSGVVHLGEFRHTLSQLTVQVIADESMNQDIRISNLEVFTTKAEAILNIHNGILAVGGDKEFTYPLVTGIQSFSPDPISETVLLFPETEENMYIRITVGTETPDNWVSATYSIYSFKNMTNDGEELTLESGKNTTLRIRVAGVPVQQEDDQITLEGILSEWIYKGDFGVTIQ